MKKIIPFILLFFTLFSLPATSQNSSIKRMNILFVFADDWGRYASCYKGIDGRATLNDIIQTPHVDQVAKQGVLFKNAFVNAPSCTPCRSSMLSGRYFFNCELGAILNGATWSDSIPSYPLMLRDAGYTIGKSYKVWGPGTNPDAPFGGQKYAFEKRGILPQHFSTNVTAMMMKGAKLPDAKQKILDQVRDNFDDFIASTEKGKPWHYFFGPVTTHRKWEKGSGKKLWGIDPNALKGKLPSFLPDVPEIREDVADYLGECQAVDAYIGVLITRLKEIGEYENTIIVLSGDHGMPGVTSGKCNLYDMGVQIPLIVRIPGTKGGRVVQDFVRLPDLAPTFLEIGGISPPKNLYGKSLLPLLKSDQSGIIDSKRDWVITGRERHVAAAREGNLPYPMRSLRTPDYVYIRNFEPDRWPMGSPGPITPSFTPTNNDLEQETYTAFSDMDSSPTKAWLVENRSTAFGKWYYQIAFGKRPKEELYQVRKDPDMVHNLARNPKFTQIKKRLSDRLLAELTRAKDPRMIENPVRYEKKPYTDVLTGTKPK